MSTMMALKGERALSLVRNVAGPVGVPNEKKRGIGTVAMEAIRSGANNEEALLAVLREFPTAATTPNCINWYRQKLRRDGERVMTARQLKRAGLAAARRPA